MENLKEIRCTHCKKKLFDSRGIFESITIKCSRCKQINELSATSAGNNRAPASTQHEIIKH